MNTFKIRFNEFFSLWQNYSFAYACYSILWWFCIYTRPPFCNKISTFALNKKTKWLDKYFSKNYKEVIEKEKSSAITVTDDAYIVNLKVVEKFAEPFTLLYECLKDFSFHPATIKTMLTAEGNTIFKTGKHIARKEKSKIIVSCLGLI